MAPIVVLDTSVLLSAGKNVLSSFGESDVIIPLVVIKELESKRSNPEIGLSARSVLRALEELGQKENLRSGVSLGEGLGTLRIEVNHVTNVPAELAGNVTNDVRIITVAYNLSQEGQDVTLISNDFSLKILAQVVGLKTSSVSRKTDEIDELIHDVRKIDVPDSVIDEIYENKTVKLQDELPLNTAVLLCGLKGSAIAVARPDFSFDLVKGDQQVGSHVGRGLEQKIAVNHLMNDNIGVVSLSGTAGSGKSFWMLNAALNLVRDGRNKYEKIVVFRPVNPVGGQHQDLGFLPGTLDEKLAPHAQAIYDTLGTIVGTQEAERIKRNGIIEFASISHVRGRTLANCIVICDELQNVEASTILTLISRLGVNARVFLGWDTAQRDAQYIGKYDGIYRIVKNLYGHQLFAHVNFRTSQRSKISAMVSGLLDEM